MPRMMLYGVVINIVIASCLLDAGFDTKNSGVAQNNALIKGDNRKEAVDVHELCASYERSVVIDSITHGDDIVKVMHLAALYHHGFGDLQQDRQKAIQYWNALASQTIDLEMQAHARQMLNDSYSQKDEC